MLICWILLYNYCEPIFSDILVNFYLVLTNSRNFQPLFDFKNVNHFSVFFSKKMHFITTSQNLCSFSHYVNQRNPHRFLWTMWITWCITPLFQGFPLFPVCITLRIKCGKSIGPSHSLYIFYNCEYSENLGTDFCLFFHIFILATR